MNEVLALVLILVLAASGYAAGRLHGQLGYRMGYRFGYRQGYFDGDRSSWSRRRRDLQAAVASVLSAPAEIRTELFPPSQATGTTYTSDTNADGFADDEDDDELADVAVAPVTHPAGRSTGRTGRLASDATMQLREPRSSVALLDAARRNQPKHAQ